MFPSSCITSGLAFIQMGTHLAQLHFEDCGCLLAPPPTTNLNTRVRLHPLLSNGLANLLLMACPFSFRFGSSSDSSACSFAARVCACWVLLVHGIESCCVSFRGVGLLMACEMLRPKHPASSLLMLSFSG